MHCFFFKGHLVKTFCLHRIWFLIYMLHLTHTPLVTTVWSGLLVPNWRQSNGARFHRKDGRISFSNLHHYVSLSLRFGAVVEQKCCVAWMIYFTRIKAIKYLGKTVHRSCSLSGAVLMSWIFGNFDYPVMFLIL